MQKELGKEGTFDNEFQYLVEKTLSIDEDWKSYKTYLKFMLITDSGDIGDLFGLSTNARFSKI